MMRARMQAQPHPSQFLSLRESGAWVNALEPASQIESKSVRGNPDGTDIYQISSLPALTGPIDGATLKPRYPIWSPTPSRGFARQPRAPARLCPAPSNDLSRPRLHSSSGRMPHLVRCALVRPVLLSHPIY